MSSGSKLSQKLSNIAATWPRDPFRPNIQLSNFLQSLATHPALTPSAIQAVQVLRDSAIQKKYPLSSKTLQPASMPKHYDRLVEGFRRSEKGAGRPLWKIFFGIWN